jgi:ribosome biogenesis GTPase
MPEGKIVKALSGFYYVFSDNKVIQCRSRGVFRKNKVNPLVGDEVIFQAENNLEGYILEVKERKNSLVRPPIANVDQAILVFSATEPDFSTALLDRFLVLIELLTSSETDEGLKELIPFLNGVITVFAGQSGVGKSSLLNALRPDLELKTDQISNHLGRGKHTTRHVELIPIGDGLVADTPGFSSLEFTDIEQEDLNNCFPEIRKLSEACKFRGCLHLAEPKCAVKKGLENGEVPSYRYKHYKEFLEEIKDRKPRY